MSGELVTVGWQSVEDCVPNNPRAVLATDMEAYYVAIYCSGNWSPADSDDDFDSYISHWMELPELPEE